MKQTFNSFGELTANSKDFARRLLILGGNRLELLKVEVQEELELLLHAVLLALGVAALGLLAGITVTALITVLGWAYSPVAVLLTLSVLYTASTVFLYRRLTRLFRDWQTFPSSFAQLRKDHACLEKKLA